MRQTWLLEHLRVGKQEKVEVLPSGLVCTERQSLDLPLQLQQQGASILLGRCRHSQQVASKYGSYYQTRALVFGKRP